MMLSMFKHNLRDLRKWNEDWQIGDTAECILHQHQWNKNLPPHLRPRFGQQFTVIGYEDGKAVGHDSIQYFLDLKDWPVMLSTIAFRKVRPVQSVVERIMSEKSPGPDRVREKEPTI